MKLFPSIQGSCCAGCTNYPEVGSSLRVALVGQPNCGKSTLFNAIAGYRSATGNFPGTTVRLTWSRVRVKTSQLEVFDVPGIYSLSASSPAEDAAKEFLLNGGVDVIVNVVDASLLNRGLELTLELLRLGIPMVLCLNMMDEARHQGMAIRSDLLSELLHIPVMETEAHRGTGVPELFDYVVNGRNRPPTHVDLVEQRSEKESAAERCECGLDRGSCHAGSGQLLVTELREGSDGLQPQTGPQAREMTVDLREEAVGVRDHPADSLIQPERHARARQLTEQCVTRGRPRADFRLVVDNLLTHPVWGYVFLLLLLGGFFWAVFGVGGWIETKLLAALGTALPPMSARLAGHPLALALVRGLWDGFVGGAAIVLPYLLPFLLGLALLEDIGYLPRVAYLLDGLCHRMGLHGTSVVPIMLGYGCSVPACLATRVLPSSRDRFLATVLATLVPCSARSTVIFALAAFYLGPVWALGIFAFNGLVVFFSGWLLTRLWPEISPGMILEIPRYQWPSLRITSRKVWLRLREFVVVSWPLLVGGSAVLGLAEFWHWDRLINAGLSPLMSILGLPSSVGVTLIFGVLRKELSMIMLVQALGTTNIHAALSAAQILTFTLFVTFYIPCLATLVAMTKEIGSKLTALAAAYSFLLATCLCIAARIVLNAIHIA